MTREDQPATGLWNRREKTYEGGTKLQVLARESVALVRAAACDALSGQRSRGLRVEQDPSIVVVD